MLLTKLLPRIGGAPYLYDRFAAQENVDEMRRRYPDIGTVARLDLERTGRGGGRRVCSTLFIASGTLYHLSTPGETRQ